jgi:hypothetical protein
MYRAAFAAKIAAQIDCGRKAELAKQWIKIRSREKRGMGSNPIIGISENAVS